MSGSFASMKTDDIPNYKIEHADADSNASDYDMDMDILDEIVTDKGPMDEKEEDYDDEVIEDMNACMNELGNDMIVTTKNGHVPHTPTIDNDEDIQIDLADNEFVVSGD